MSADVLGATSTVGAAAGGADVSGGEGLQAAISTAAANTATRSTALHIERQANTREGRLSFPEHISTPANPVASNRGLGGELTPGSALASAVRAREKRSGMVRQTNGEARTL